MKYLILGGGPAGLSFANALLQRGRDNFIVLEANKEAGGLCRSRDVDGSPLDIGGGHFLDVRRQKVDGFLFGFMPIDEWDMYVRNSQIEINGHYLNHPFEANIWQLDIDSQVEYLKSIAAAGCNTGMEMPKEFVHGFSGNLGIR
jgi:protoporphyrinogen oxidase